MKNNVDLLNADGLDEGIFYSSTDGVATYLSPTESDGSIAKISRENTALAGQGKGDGSVNVALAGQGKGGTNDSSVVVTAGQGKGTPTKVGATINAGNRPLGVGTAPKSTPAEKIVKKDDVKTGSDKSENIPADTTADDGKILGMPKMVFYIGLGLVVAVGGFFAYKKFKK